MKPKQRTYKTARADDAVEKLDSLIDSLIEFEDFKTNILPQFQKAIREKKSAQEIYSMAQSMVAARIATDALISPKAEHRLAAGKEVLDRGIGKAAEKIEHTHKYENLSDEELAALARSEEDSLQDVKH